MIGIWVFGIAIGIGSVREFKGFFLSGHVKYRRTREKLG